MVAGNDIPAFSRGWVRGDLDLVSTESTAAWGLESGPRGFMLPPIGRMAPKYKLAREHAKSRFVNVWIYKDGFETELSQTGVSKVVYYEMLSTHALPQFDPGNNRLAGTPATNIAFNDFVSQVEPEFGTRTAVEEIGIYYSSSSLMTRFTPGGYLDHAAQPHQFGFWGWATALGELHYQYRALPEWKLDSAALSELRVLVVPESEVFDSADVTDVLTPWVQGGGRLIVTGASGKRLGESGNFDVSSGGYTLSSLTGVTDIASAPSEQLRNIGSGLVLYLRDNIGMDFYNADVSRSLLLPQFSSAINNVLTGGGPLLIGPNGVSDSVGLTLYEDPAAGKLFVDVNNFDIHVATDQINDTGQLTFDVALPLWLQGGTLQVSAVSPELTPTVDLLLLAPDRVQITLDSVRYYTSVLLESTLAGDFDTDGDADGIDFLNWQIGFGISSGASLADGDANGDGKVDAADLQLWQTNFGVVTTASMAANSLAIPEPASAMLYLCGLAAMLLARAAADK
jgi:hypothetical protein